MKKLFNLPTHLRAESAITDGVASKREPVVAAIIAGIQPVLTSQPQNLSQIDGIDNIFEKRLFAAGVGSYWEVANLHNTVFEQILKLDELQHSDFPFDEVRANAFSMAQQTETIGLIWEGQQVDDFDAVAGMGDSFEQQHA
jgi:hypothetical protein